MHKLLFITGTHHTRRIAAKSTLRDGALYAFEQFREAYIERPSDLVRHRQGNVLLASLHRPHIAAVEAALVREPFLRKSLLPAQGSDTFPKFFMNFLHSRNSPCMLSGQSTAYRWSPYRETTLIGRARRTFDYEEIASCFYRFTSLFHSMH